MGTKKYAERLAATKVASVTWDGVQSVNFALDETDENALHVQGGDPTGGVCLVHSPSEQCVVDAFTELRLTRHALLVRFTQEGKRAFGVPSVQVDFSIDDRAWKKMARVLGAICKGKGFYSCSAPANPNADRIAG